MPNELSLDLLISWAIFYGFFNIHIKHQTSSYKISEKLDLALMISILLALTTSFGLLIFYFIKVSWYWPFVLFMFGGSLGVILTKVFLGICNALQQLIITNGSEYDTSIGYVILIFTSFIIWPLSAYWFFNILITM